MANAHPPAGSSDRSSIGRTIRIRGSLEGNEDLLILGNLEGRVDLNGCHLQIGEGASVQADIRAREVSVAGTASGKIEPSELLAVHATGSLSGEIHTPRLIAQPGSRLQGRFVVGFPLDGQAAPIPDFDGVRRMVETEVEGLADHQLDFSAKSPDWARWSIRRQVSHMANSVIFWLVGRWRDVLWKDRRPDPELVKISLADHGNDRMLDPETYRDIQTLLRMLQRSIGLIREIASRETAQTLREKKLALKLPPDAKLGTSGESAHELWEKYSRAHESGISRDKGDPHTWVFTLEGTLRHLYYEHLAHLRTIQRLKGLQGLKTRVTLPRVGYLTFEEYWTP